MSKKRHHDGRESGDEERDPIADYKEWTDHRYDPGYFTGGRLPPATRAWQKMLSPRDKKIVLFVIVGGLTILLGLQLWAWFRGPEMTAQPPGFLQPKG